jgi:hypothetical protein
MGDVRRRGHSVQVKLGGDEVSVLRALVVQVRDLLVSDGDGATESESDDPLESLVGLSATDVSPPSDPALRRLLPDAYGDDADAATEFRRLMDSDLRRIKAEALEQILEDLPADDTGSVALRLAPQQVEDWLQGLTDIRLVVGTRLDVTEDIAATWEQLDPRDPRTPLLVAYGWLGWLQESMVEALDG